MPAPIVVMGVAGCGKSTVGDALARRLGIAFLDADDLHPAVNIEKMARGQPLDDADREPWLAAVGDWLAVHRDGGVTACSALRRHYRDQLRRYCPQAVFVHLDVPPEVIETRLAGRTRHFMSATLSASQFATLEPLAGVESGITLDATASVDQLVGQCLSATLITS
ncbi:gluconokinase [Mycobacterium sp. OTB74]|uniref:gluconokinase n=1 Tax=Mycobacterium sp. OTB74 TaxID=1853452 RepID=UPI002476B436|nr:gluconokinase [Mycobacterium sp. OTB74]MDH6244136.1 gluconokinase [Mycobacterium sp. OTB74]